MSNHVNAEGGNQFNQRQQRWDDLDRKFWELYQTIDEGKLRRNVRLLAVFCIPLFSMVIGCVVFMLFTAPPSIIVWPFTIFMFGLIILSSNSICKELAIWAPEKVIS